MTPPRIVIHLGQHKTGSKYLQAFLAANRERLAEHGVLYPADAPNEAASAYRNSHFGLFALLRDEAAISAQFARWQHALAAANAHTLLLSSEDLFDMQTAHELSWTPQQVERAAKRLAAQLATLGWTPTLVVYLRRPDTLLDAHYAQYIKGRATNDLCFEAFHDAFRARLDAPAILAAWTRNFPAASILVRAYQENAASFDIVRDFFRHVLDFPPDTRWQAVSSDLESMNITPDLRYIELLRRINAGHWTGRFISHKEVLEFAFQQRGRRRHGSFLSPAQSRALADEFGAGLDRIAREFCGREHFFDPPWHADATTRKRATVRLGFTGQAVILTQLLLARARSKRAKG